MESFKIKHFEKNNPGHSFPWFESLDATETQLLRETLAQKVGLYSVIDNLLLVKRLDALASTVQHINTKVDLFDLASTLKELRINPHKVVYINWYRYDQIDRIQFEDLVRYFDDLWYPDIDDIDIFDDTLEWILSVTHYGMLKLARFNNS